MFGVSLPELMVVFAVILLVLGPERLPAVARSLGKITGQLKRSTHSLRKEFYNSVYTPDSDLRRELAEATSELRAVKDAFQHQGNDPLCPDTPQEVPEEPVAVVPEKKLKEKTNTESKND